MGDVAVVGGRREDGVQVDGVDAQLGQIVEALDDAGQIAALKAVGSGRAAPGLELHTCSRRAGAVVVGVAGEAVGEYLIEDGISNPIGGYNVHPVTCVDDIMVLISSGESLTGALSLRFADPPGL